MKKILNLILLVVLVAIMLWLSWGSSVLAGVNGDGLKNYFTFLYHSLYGKGIWFDGMNYPYGEHIVFTDAQPLFSVALGYLRGILPVSYGLVSGILFTLPAISLLIALVYTQKIFLHYKLPYSWSIVFAVLLNIMSPQLRCISGHYALSYVCFIPALFYWSVLYNSSGSRKYITRIFLWTLLFSFIHLYYLAITAFWVLFYVIGIFIFQRKPFAEKAMKAVHMILAGGIAFIIVKVIMLLTDPVTDRPEVPWAGVENSISLPDIFTSVLSPLWQLIPQTEAISLGGGLAYAGVVSIVICILALPVLIISALKKKNNVFTRDDFQVWLWVALGALLLSMMIPFIWCFRCREYIPVFRQFRALSRFAWIYYYIVTIYAVIMLYRWYYKSRQTNYRGVVTMIVVIAVIVWGYESKGSAEYLAGIIKGTQEKYHDVDDNSWNNFLEKKGFSKDSFQSVLFIPYVHVGTEKLGNNSHLETRMAPVYTASLQLHLPVMDVNMSRSSWQQAFKQVKISGGPFAEKPVLEELKDSRPVLLLSPEEIVLNPDEQYLLSASEYIGTKDGCRGYAFYPGKLLSIDEQNRAFARSVIAGKVTDTCLLCDSNSYFIEHYDNGNASEKLFGAGAEQAVTEYIKEIENINVQLSGSGRTYEFSVWVLVNDHDYRLPSFGLDCFDSTGISLATYRFNINQSADNHRMWLRASGYFTLPPGCSEVSVTVFNIVYPAYIALDEMQLRPVGATIISRSADGSVIANNHLCE